MWFQAVAKDTALKAFTLIELMIVVTIIGILASVAIPSFQSYVLNAKLAEGITGIGALQKAQQMLRIDRGYYVSYTYMEIPTPGTRNSLSARLNAPLDAEGTWNTLLGAPLSMDTVGYFSYAALAGHSNSAGDLFFNFYSVPDDSFTFNSGFDVGNITPFSDGEEKGEVLPWTNDSIGIAQGPNEHWVALMAVANFKTSGAEGEREPLTWVAQVLSESTGVSMSPIIVLNKGN